MKKRFVKAMSLVTAAAMLLSTVSGIGVWKQKREAHAANNVVLEDPTIQRNDAMLAGQQVTWDCVYFGSYPQAEVVSSAAAYTALPDGLYTPKDMVYDRTIYDVLESSNNWINDELTWNGVRYRRVRRDKATYTAEEGDNYYQWEDGATWHYFKYAPIKWRVLYTDGAKALLLADTALDNQFYDQSYQRVTWETCTVRSWLNGYEARQNLYGVDYEGRGFIDSAFDEEESEAVLEMQLTDEAGEMTTDKVFLLSKADMSGTGAAEFYGFLSDEYAIDEARMSYSSTYAKAMGTSFIKMPNYQNGERLGSCGQLLCNDNSEASTNTFCTQPNGLFMSEQNINTGVSTGGIQSCYAIRPALCLDLSQVEQYDFAGTVCSDGTEQTVQEVIGDRETLPPASVATGSVTPSGDASPSVDPSTPTRRPSASPSATPTQKPSGSPSAMPTEPVETDDPQSMETTEPAGDIYIKNIVYKGKCFNDEETQGRYKITKTGENGTVIYLRPLDKTKKNVTIPDEVMYKDNIYRVVAVGEHAFYKNKNLRQITLGDNVTKISNRAFYKCTNLKNINFNKKLKRIGTKAFFRCNSLKKIVLPSKVEHIGVRAFYKCKKLQKAVMSKNMLEIGTKSFYQCKKLTLDMKKVKKRHIAMGRKPFTGIKQVKYGKVKTRP